MSEKACHDCHTITAKSNCPSCKASGLSDDFSGLVIVFDPEASAIAKTMEISKKGRYALRVR
ncbi:MAG: transcription elongation factor subunit Spt4 [Candidatus Bathyarchaeota archaeon]